MIWNIATAIFILHLCAQAHLQLDIPSKIRTEETTLQGVISEVNSQSLNKSERLAVLNNAALILEQYNPHRFIHLNYLNVDPAKMLRDLESELDAMPNFEFHRRVSRIFTLMDDLHTVYNPPYPLNESFAFLEFSISRYYRPNETTPTYFIPDGNFTVITINDVPTHKLAIQLGTRGYGSNKASREVNGLMALTIRSLAYDKIPRNANATLWLSNGVSDFNVSVPWNFLTLSPSSLLDGGFATTATKTSLSERLSLFKASYDPKKDLYRSFPAAQKNSFSDVQDSEPKVIRIPVSPLAVEFFEAFEVITSSSTYGYIIIKTFLPDVPSTFSGSIFQFFQYLTGQLSQTLQNMSYDAIAVDVSDNGGGSLFLVKPTFELLTDKNIPPMPVVSRATNLTLSMYSLHSNDGDDLFLPAVKQFFEIGEQFTGPIAYLLNYTNLYDGLVSLPRAPQVFFGKVIVVTNAHSYSASDLLASWVRDTDAGLILGLDEATGGGGASTLQFSELQSSYPKSFPSKMPPGVSFSTAAIRLFRSGKHIGGTLLENFGVRPLKRYYVTYRDVVDRRKDFLIYLGKHVAAVI